MNNIFCTTNKIGKRFDLKGSTQGRVTGADKDITVALKDNDLLRDKIKFKVGQAHKERLMEIIKKDKEFFQKCEIIDYSLLVGIHEKLEKDRTEEHDQQLDIDKISMQQVESDAESRLDYINDFAVAPSRKKFYEAHEGGL